MSIRSWGAFEKQVRLAGSSMLGELDQYANSVLIAGCQRSGTTVVTSILNQCEAYGKFKYTKDSELDAALVLAGKQALDPGRYCFQTTYLNERYPEYFSHSNFKLIWVLREPAPVVESMLYNWSRYSLNRLYKGVGAPHLQVVGGAEPKLWSKSYVPKLKKACASYIGKLQQTRILHEKLSSARMCIIDYRDVMSRPQQIFEHVFSFLNLEFKTDYCSALLDGHKSKKKKSLQKQKIAAIELMCDPVYRDALTLRSC